MADNFYENDAIIMCNTYFRTLYRIANKNIIFLRQIMSDRDSIEFDSLLDSIGQEQQFTLAAKESALEQCIYLFVEGESEELAFRILLEEGVNLKFDDFGVVIANYSGNGSLQNMVRLMSQTLGHSRPMIFTFDDDNKSLISSLGQVPANVHLFKIPYKPAVTFKDGQKGGSFEESFGANDFIDACFETTLLKMNPQVLKSDFIIYFDENKPFHAQIVKFLKSQGLATYTPSKIEIAEHMATNCNSVPETYVKLADLIKKIRSQEPVKVKI